MVTLTFSVNESFVSKNQELDECILKCINQSYGSSKNRRFFDINGRSVLRIYLDVTNIVLGVLRATYNKISSI